MFKNFIDNAYRCADLDDCLLWSLPVGAMLEEYRLGGGERTIAKGYNELWTNYAHKFRDLLKEMGGPVLDDAPTKKEEVKPKRRPRSVEDKKAKGKAKPKPKAPSIAQAKADEEPAAAAAGATEGGGEAAAAPAATTLPPVASAKPKAKAEAKSSPAAADTLGLASPEQPKRTRLKRYVPTRSLPNLACTFGAAPGCPIAHPSEYELSKSFSLISRALNHLEKESRIVHRIDREDIKAAMKMTQTAKYMASEEGSRAEGVIIKAPEGEEDDN